jgi:hypothetical protein
VYSSEFRNGIVDRSSLATAVTIPTACPACQSPAITTAGRKPDDNAYWRCGDCGEIWNASRREGGRQRRPAWR